MPRPTTKDELILIANQNFMTLCTLIKSMSEEDRQRIFLFEDRDRNIRDVLVHLYEWHQLLINWVNKNHQGQEAHFLPDPYNWKTYPAMNIEFWKKHQQTPLAEAIYLVQRSHADVIDIIEQYSDEELFTKKHFSWTGSTNLGGYCISATSSHYDWAIKKIKKQKKALIQ